MTLTKKESRGQSYALAFGIPVGLMLIVMLIAGSEPFGGDVSMLYSDMYHQYFPFWVEFGRAIREGDGLLWNWAAGMGMDYLSLISYYLASPLNLISAIVPAGWELEVYSLLMPVKLGLASLFFAIFLRHTFQKEDISISLFGAMYALCGWALAYQWNVMWLDTFALLPLTVLGMVRLLRDKKPLLYTITLFLSIFSNYYIGFFTCIFILLLFFVYEISRWRGFGRFCADFVRIGWFTVLAIGMSCILELPALAGLQNTQSSVNKFPEGFKLNIADENTWAGLFDAMRQVAGNTLGGVVPSFKEGLPNLYCGVGSMILAVLFLTCKEVKLRDKFFSLVLLIFFMVSFIVRQLDYIWHGFHFTNMIPYRFSFLFSFVVLYMAYRAWTLRESFRLWQLILAGLAAVGLILCSEDRLEPIFLAYNLGFGAVYLISLGYFLPGKVPAPAEGEEEPDPEEVLAYVEKRDSKRSFATLCLCAVFALELCMNVLNFGVRFSYTYNTNYPKGTADTVSVLEYMEEREKDNLFYRAETTHSQTLNDGALNGYKGISTFTSSANVRVTEFMRTLGYGAKNTYNRYCFEESSPVANLFLGLKYMIERSGEVEANRYFDPIFASGEVYLLENNAYLPLGFLAQSELSDLVLTGSDHFDIQNALFSAATGLYADVWHPMEPQITGEELTISSISGPTVKYSGSQSGASMVYSFTADREGFVCLDFDVTKRNSYTVYLNGEKLYSESLSLTQMIAACDVIPGDVIEIDLTCKQGEDGRMTIRAAILDDALFRRGVEKLSESTLELTEFDTTYLCGTVDAAKDGLLYTSIPQDGGWSAIVDGEEAEAVLVGDVMLAVPMTAGAHTVEFVYENKAFAIGWKISAICLLLLATTAPLYYTKRKKGRFEK
ncbi:MAG: YfhO family protein [Oscillospiraceae bacterium]|nr:YfhO family protein [Oscillospiraceae bacterium]